MADGHRAKQRSPSPPDHQHAWRMTMHMDGCHWYASTFTCECGAQRETYDERDVKADSYSLVWMDSEGMDEPCKRCEELLAGATPEHRITGNEETNDAA